MKKIYSCGMCGSPCNKDGYQIAEVPDNYDPDNYEHTYCIECHNEEVACQNTRIRVTHEMAMDAECPELEGTLW